jgi:hypothetical protein
MYHAVMVTLPWLVAHAVFWWQPSQSVHCAAGLEAKPGPVACDVGMWSESPDRLHIVQYFAVCLLCA